MPGTRKTWKTSLELSRYGGTKWVFSLESIFQSWLLIYVYIWRQIPFTAKEHAFVRNLLLSVLCRNCTSAWHRVTLGTLGHLCHHYRATFPNSLTQTISIFLSLCNVLWKNTLKVRRAPTSSGTAILKIPTDKFSSQPGPGCPGLKTQEESSLHRAVCVTTASFVSSLLLPGPTMPPQGIHVSGLSESSLL